MNTFKKQFFLDLRMENKEPLKVDVIDTLTIGQDPRNDIIIHDEKIKNTKIKIESKEENLALQYSGSFQQVFLNHTRIEEGKKYLLELGDSLEFLQTKIIVGEEIVKIHQSQTVKPLLFKPVQEMPLTNLPHLAEPDRKKIQPAPLYRPKAKKAEKPIEQKEPRRFFSLFLTKIYALCTDFLLTYVLLIILLPTFYLHHYAQEILAYLQGFIPTTHYHSVIPYLIAWYLLSFVQTLLFGTTLGQFLTGLRNKTKNEFGRLILSRLKTFVFSLILFPSQNSISEKQIFKGVKKYGLPIVFFFIFLSPFFLRSPYNESLTKIVDQKNVRKQLHSKSLSTHSKTLDLHLNIDLPSRYLMTPNMDSGVKKIGLTFFDLQRKEKIYIFETLDISYDEIDHVLSYGNAFYRIFQTSLLKDQPLEMRKMLISNALLSSPLTISSTLSSFGPFYGSALLLKRDLIDNLKTSDLIINLYSPKTPQFFIGSSKKSYFYLLTPTSLKRFEIQSPSSKNLELAFEEQVFSKFTAKASEQAVLNKQTVGLFEAIDSFFHGDEQSILTYYIEIANNLDVAKTLYGQEDLTKNAKAAVLESASMSMNLIKNKNLRSSLNDIINQLTPMEKPGEKR